MYRNAPDIKPMDVIGAVVIIVVIAVMFVWALSPKSTVTETAPVQSEGPSLGQQLIFPRGWHLVGIISYAYSAGSGPYVTYICQRDTNSSLVRTCTPRTVAKEISYATDTP